VTVPEPATLVGMLSGLLMLSFRIVFKVGVGRNFRMSGAKFKKAKK
jgi:hypothetical protein